MLTILRRSVAFHKTKFKFLRRVNMNSLNDVRIGVVVLALSTFPVPAQVLFSDGFEGYAAGGNYLDKNIAGPNSAPNGSGNPWFGPFPPNLVVVGTTGSVSPHGGNNMVRGVLPGDVDQDWVNIAYRFNGGSPFTGNLMFDWWFYDPSGPGDSNFRDYGVLGFYNTAPNNTDYPGSGSLNSGVSQLQRLSLGAFNPAGFDSTKYQVRVGGATDGLTGGWFNTSITRSVGWHEGRIALGSALGDGTTTVSFFIDNMITPVLTHNSVTANGYNVLELNGDAGSTTGYFDDVSLSLIPEPGAAALLACGGLTWLTLRRRK